MPLAISLGAGGRGSARGRVMAPPRCRAARSKELRCTRQLREASRGSSDARGSCEKHAERPEMHATAARSLPGQAGTKRRTPIPQKGAGNRVIPFYELRSLDSSGVAVHAGRERYLTVRDKMEGLTLPSLVGSYRSSLTREDEFAYPCRLTFTGYAQV